MKVLLTGQLAVGKLRVIDSIKKSSNKTNVIAKCFEKISKDELILVVIGNDKEEAFE